MDQTWKPLRSEIDLMDLLQLFDGVMLSFLPEITGEHILQLTHLAGYGTAQPSKIETLAFTHGPSRKKKIFKSAI